jgi:hypothetical protein
MIKYSMVDDPRHFDTEIDEDIRAGVLLTILLYHDSGGIGLSECEKFIYAVDRTILVDYDRLKWSLEWLLWVGCIKEVNEKYRASDDIYLKFAHSDEMYLERLQDIKYYINRIIDDSSLPNVILNPKIINEKKYNRKIICHDRFKGYMFLILIPLSFFGLIGLLIFFLYKILK